MRITNKKLSKKQILVATLAVAVAICGSVFALDKIGVISIFPKETVPNISKEPTPQEKKSEEKVENKEINEEVTQQKITKKSLLRKVNLHQYQQTTRQSSSQPIKMGITLQLS